MLLESIALFSYKLNSRHRVAVAVPFVVLKPVFSIRMCPYNRSQPFHSFPHLFVLFTYLFFSSISQYKGLNTLV